MQLSEHRVVTRFFACLLTWRKMKSRRQGAARAAAFVAVTLVASALYGCFSWLGADDVRASSEDREDLEGPWRYEDGEYRLRGPAGAKEADLGPRVGSVKRKGAPFFALAYHYRALVYEAPGSKAKRMGIVRRGTRLHATEQVKAGGCKHGWYRLAEGGYVCQQGGFLVSREKKPFWIRQPEADLNKALFYRYARVKTPGALRYVRIPTVAEEQTIAKALKAKGKSKPSLPEVVQAQMVGDYFVAVDRIETEGKRRFYRTVRGRYVRVRDLELRPAPRMHGERLNKKKTLPWAFVYGEDEAKLLRKRKGRFVEVGVAEPHGRFPLRAVESHKGKAYAVGPDGFAVTLERARIARRVKRPKGVAANEKWVHVNLTDQTLVAYEGDKPVFVTLVSSGKKEGGHTTPTGLYWVGDKHVSTTMSGEDDIDGVYEVAEVPWTQFYHGSYALHGAYWHDTFGETRSHGCTNLAPPDARWLFYWTTPEVPDGFHARQRARGTAVYISNEPPVRPAKSRALGDPTLFDGEPSSDDEESLAASSQQDVGETT